MSDPPRHMQVLYRSASTQAVVVGWDDGTIHEVAVGIGPEYPCAKRVNCEHIRVLRRDENGSRCYWIDERKAGHTLDSTGTYQSIRLQPFTCNCDGHMLFCAFDFYFGWFVYDVAPRFALPKGRLL